MLRRELLQTLGALPLLAACQRAQPTAPPVLTQPLPPPTQERHNMPTTLQNSPLMPVLFLAHGAPMLLDDEVWMNELNAWAHDLPKPKAILMVSAHWDAQPLAIGATTTVPLVYDFYGFPDRYYGIQYASPGAPLLAQQVRELLLSRGIPFVDQPKRGLDHGAYVPLMGMYPDADIPVLQISLPGLDSSAVFALGQALEPLRREGVLIVGSGFLTHNLRYAMVKGIPSWAKEFDAWTQDTLQRRDYDGLRDYMQKGPFARMALPTTEHFVPVLLAAGAAQDETKIQFPITGFWMDGPMTRRSVQFG